MNPGAVLIHTYIHTHAHNYIFDEAKMRRKCSCSTNFDNKTMHDNKFTEMKQYFRSSKPNVNANHSKSVKRRKRWSTFDGTKSYMASVQ